jgi:glycosyltransferase involved in cell wall biosynthesis
MKIGIFSKFEMSGGSEFRCAELASSIAKYTPHDAYLLAERTIPIKILDKLDKRVNLELNVMTKEENSKILYEMDRILVVNTDSRDFTKLEYWEGKTTRANVFVDMTKIKQIAFLFNFIIGPAKQLIPLTKKCKDVRLIPANKRFFNEVTNQSRFDTVRHLPRMTLVSPIDPTSVYHSKTYSDKIRIGKHSMSSGSKWNDDHVKVIKEINKKYKDKIVWDFMGMPGSMKRQLKGISNIILRDTFTATVSDYLANIDIFFFFLSWKRNEPFARASAEAMVSGCPIIATADGAGNEEQVLPGNNGFLFKKTEDAIKHLEYLINNPERIKQMGKNSQLYAREYESKTVINKLIKFLL